MHMAATIIGMALVAYAVRLSGLALSNIALPPFWMRTLRFVPLAVFASLIAVSVPGQAGEAGIRLVAALGAAVVLWHRRQPWVGLVIGMGLLWLLRLLKIAG
jgi:branched-subunit amino acid transport protein